MHRASLLLLLTLPLAAQQAASPDADIFAAGHILRVNIQMPAEDWLYVRTSHRNGGEDSAAIAEDAYEYR